MVASAIVLHVKCPECGEKVAVMRNRRLGYFVRAHRFGVIKQRCSLSRAKVPITLGVKLV